MKPTIKQIAENSKTFEEFRLKNALFNRLFHPNHRPSNDTDKFTKQTTKRQKNLKQIAQSCMTFEEFCNKVEEE